MTDTSQLILATSVVLFVSCICSLLEAALYSLSPGQVETLAGHGRTSRRLLKRLKEDVDRPISAILSLNTLANTGGAATQQSIAPWGSADASTSPAFSVDARWTIQI